jgi:hypothetical protein
MASLKGVTHRTLAKSPRIAIERFDIYLDTETYPYSPNIFGEAVLTHSHAFDVDPAEGVATIYERALPISNPDLLTSYFDGNVAVQEDLPKEPVRMDARDAEPLDDDSFWAIIALAEGRMKAKDINVAKRALAAKPTEYILRFAQTLAAKFHELDHPSTVPWMTTRDGQSGVNSYAAREKRAVLIGSGRAVFDQTVANPGSTEAIRSTADSWMVSRLANIAIDAKTRSWTVIETLHDIDGVANNVDNWRGVDVVVDPKPAPFTDEEAAAHQKWIDETDAAMTEQFGYPSNFAKAVEAQNSSSHWHAVRFIGMRGDIAHEFITLVDVGRFEHPLAPGWERDAVAGEAARHGVELTPWIESTDAHVSYLFTLFIFTIKRRSTLSEADYRARYFLD